MFSLLINTKKTTLIFPNSQKLWAFFSMAEISEFRIDSSKHAFTGKLQVSDIAVAKQRLGANELIEGNSIFRNSKMQSALNFSQLFLAAFNCLFAAFLFAIHNK